MRKIKYIKSEKFFAKEYKDGIIVAFKNIGAPSLSYANQIHELVSKSLGVDLFVSDIVESISGSINHKDNIKDSLFIYVKNGISISASGICLCCTKDYLEVKYNSENVLIIQKNGWRKFLFTTCILLLLCICALNTIFILHNFFDDTNVKIPDEPPVPNVNIIPNDNENRESEKYPRPIEEIVEVVETNAAKDEELIKEVSIAPTVADDFILIPKGTLKRLFTGYDDKMNNIYKDFPLDEFYICNHEVTQKEYMQIMGSNPSIIKGDDIPVNAVQYIDAIMYCNARSKAEGYDGFYDIDNNIITIKPHSNGYRLPNHYEWVYAARKDESTKTEYASGNHIKKVAWYGGNSKNTLHAVCTTIESNGRGIYDMNGNVSEWLWEKDFSGYNCHIGGDFLSYIGFYEKDIYGGGFCSEENGFRVVLITEDISNKNVETLTSVKYHKAEYYHAVEAKLKRELEDANRERQRKALKAEANDYITRMVSLYKEYSSDFDTNKLTIAISLCDKATQLCSEHGLFYSHKQEALKQCKHLFEAIVNGQSWPFSIKQTDKTIYQVGDYYNKEGKEGIVVTVNSDGLHGKIISLAQSEKPLQWSLDENEVINLSDSDGVINMQVIQSIEGWHKKYPAFAWCSDLGEGWYLPTFSELYRIFNNDEIRNTLVSYLLEYNPEWYLDTWDGDLWTSTEGDVFKYQALYMSFDDKYGRMTDKKYTNYVRAVTKF